MTNAARFLSDLHAVVETGILPDNTPRLVVGAMPDELMDTPKTAFRPVVKQIIYRPETDHIGGALIALTEYGAIYELYDGSTAWREVEGP